MAARPADEAAAPVHVAAISGAASGVPGEILRPPGDVIPLQQSGSMQRSCRYVATRTKTPLLFDSTAAPTSPPCCGRGRRGCHGTRGVICAETMSVKSRPGLGLQRRRVLFPLEKSPERQSRLLALGSINSDPPFRTSATGQMGPVEASEVV